MDPYVKEGNGAEQDSLPPPPPLPPNVVPESEPTKKKVVRNPMARKGFGSKGQKIPLLTNHFKVNVGSVAGNFYQYSVCNLIH